MRYSPPEVCKLEKETNEVSLIVIGNHPHIWLLQITEGITANIVQIINTLAMRPSKADASRLPTKPSKSGSQSLILRQPSHAAGTSSRQLPVTLAPHADELLTSWIDQHAAFYAVPPHDMLRHCLPEASSLHAADRSLNGDQVIRLAGVFSTEPAILRRMTFWNIAPSSRRLITAKPLQCC